MRVDNLYRQLLKSIQVRRNGPGKVKEIFMRNDFVNAIMTKTSERERNYRESERERESVPLKMGVNG